MNQTSRHSLFELIELIANEIAKASHIEELIAFNNSDYDKALREEQPIEQYVQIDKDLTSSLLDTVSIRRDLMNYLRDNY